MSLDVKEIADKYGERAFMYVEYPHQRFWSRNIGDDEFRIALKTLTSDTPVMLYVHMPYCHKQCLFCTCHVEITLDYEDVKRYLNLLYLEIDLLRKFLRENSITLNVQEIHLGGGSPTYMHEQEFDEMTERLGHLADIGKLAEFSIEIDPRRVKKDKMLYYHRKGINRISFGIQDFDLEVQRAVNRVQPAFLTENLLTADIRQLFSKGVNFDIICGLPRQTRESMKKTMEKVVEMSPDRVCLNYMHFSPEFAPHQLLMPQSEIPGPYARKILFLEALDILERAGYIRTGFDHFVKPTDDVALAMAEGKMQWNRLGVTAGRYLDTIAIGVSGTSTISPNYYFQNVYDRAEYAKALDDGKFPVYRGHILTKDDMLRRDIIHGLRNYFSADIRIFEQSYGIDFKEYFKQELACLDEFVEDGLVEVSQDMIIINELGHQFADRVCQVFDKYVMKR